jgi:6-phosphogluconolactonase/glucosamine-6-phosphate isomerase/deaminase
MIQQVLDPEAGRALPAGLVTATHAHVHWFIDQPAASRLPARAEL